MTGVGNGDDVAVGGNHTGVAVVVATGMGVSVSRMGVEIWPGAAEHADKSRLMHRIERRTFIFYWMNLDKTIMEPYE
jgi:hypothetical protein